MPRTAVATPLVEPTLERRRHDRIEAVPRAIADEAGRPARPYRCIDTLAMMERRGSITAEMRQAGEDFRNVFALAHHHRLHGMDYDRLRLPHGGRSGPHREQADGARVEDAKKAVWRQIQLVGGIASPAGSCLWHVVGAEQSIKQWAIEQGWNGRRISQEAASGILIAALGALAGQQYGRAT